MPRARRLRLTQPVQGALEVADHSGPALLVPLRLLHVDLLLQLPVKESRLDVQLVQLQVARRDYCKERPQRRVLAHRGIDLLEVDSLPLQVPLSHQPGLVPLHVPERVPLDLVTHFMGTGFTPSGFSTSSQVPFSSRDRISSSIDFRLEVTLFSPYGFLITLRLRVLPRALGVILPRCGFRR